MPRIPSMSRRPQCARKSFQVDTLERRQLLSVATTPVAAQIIRLQPEPAALTGNISQTSVFSPINRLVSPGKTAQSYLALSSYTPFKVDFNTLEQTLATAPSPEQLATGRTQPLVVSIPSPTGGYERFRVFQSQVMAPALAAQFPSITTYEGQGIDDPTATIALDNTPQGFHASVRGAGGDYFIDPYYYLNPQAGEVAYYTRNESTDQTFTCLTQDGGPNDAEMTTKDSSISPAVSGTALLGSVQRNYRIAIGATGEYTAFQGGTVTLALSAIATTVSRMDQVWERDFSIHCTLVANEANVIYTNASTDPYTAPTNPTTTNTQNETALDNASTGIGSANYDIGHVYYKCSAASGNNGLAGGIGTVGMAGQKGKGYTAFVTPVGDDFVIDYAIHELGHEMGGRHTFNNLSTTQRQGDDSTVAVEVGAGTTIMGYAGLGSANTNVTIHSDAMYHSVQFVDPTANTPVQILQYTLTNTSSPGYTSAVLTSNGNTPPSVSVAASSYNIPISTPFGLTAVGADADSDAVTYDWEQLDGGAFVPVTATIPSSTVNYGPVFRTFLPTTSATRTFPLLSTVLTGGTNDNGEQLPSVARSMHFAVLVRDNHAGGGGVAETTVDLNTIAGTAFALTTGNTATSVNGGSTQTINWTNTNTGAGTTINAANVNILLSTDGGATFPYTLAGNTANDGTETVQIPDDISSTNARIKIQPTNNVFFDINNAPITINLATSTSATPAMPALLPAYDTGVSSSDGLTKLNNSAAASVLGFSVGGTVTGAVVSVYSDGTLIGTATASGATTTVLTNGATPLTDGSHAITATQTESGKLASAASSADPISIDTVAPTITQTGTFNYDTAPQSVSFAFSESLAGTLTAGSVTVTNTTTSAATNIALSNTGTTATVTFPDGILTDGNYTAAVSPVGITDAAGNALAAGTTYNFFFLEGDANHDAIVDISDLGILASHWQSSGQTFSTGDFNYDGTVDISDLGILASHWQQNLAGPMALTVKGKGITGKQAQRIIDQLAI